jgi:ribonuclease Z
LAKLTILGSSNAVPAEKHQNTHMVLQGANHTVLIDCSINPLLRLRSIGVDHTRVSDLILTHFHPDHVSGVASYLMNMWLLGRNQPLQIYGLEHTLVRVQKMMDSYDWDTWPNLFPVHFHTLPEIELTPVLSNTEFRIYSSPVKHIVPTIGLRIESVTSQKVLAYSCDTEPCVAVENLARDADFLLHEASGASFGHTSAAQAGSLAQKANVHAVFLIHYPTGELFSERIAEEAASTFGKPVTLATDMMEFEL